MESSSLREMLRGRCRARRPIRSSARSARADWRDSDICGIISIFTRESDERKRREREGRLSDLPEYFLIVVTRDRVRAFKLGSRYSKKVKGFVVDFPREDVSFSTREDWMPVPVIELTEGGRECRVELRRDVLNPKKNPWGRGGHRGAVGVGDVGGERRGALGLGHLRGRSQGGTGLSD
jgi:hypothetical protein